jgi:hypothetical protein
VKKMIVIVGFILSFQALAQAVALEPEWKTKLRDVITNVAGTKWATKFFGEAPKPEPEITLPPIPTIVKQNTNIASYTKIQKDATAFDKLPADRKRQFDFEFLKEIFLVTRKTEARDEDLSNWLNTLDQGGSREGIYQALVLDEVYVALENMEDKSSDRLKSFSLGFSQRYLGQTFKPGSLDQFNLFSIKRIVTDKAIDLMDFYETKDIDSLYRWYAVLSSDMAKEYSAFFKNQLRQEVSEKYHYNWAKESPIQQIKSEVIIKLHIVMNGLQLLQ